MMNILHLIAIASASLLTVSCSLKEDRTPCPCWLGIDLSGCHVIREPFHNDERETSVKAVSISAWNDGFLYTRRIGHEDFGRLYEKAVPKSYVSTSVVYGEKNMIRNGYDLVIPVGEDADEIWAHAGMVACFKEFARDTARLHKQFARVRVKIANPVGDRYPYSFRLRSDTYGLDLRDLTPLEGMTEMPLTRGKDDIIEFLLIRQREEGHIWIDVYEQEDRLDSFPVHQWIEELGYSWLALDLKDIDMNIDYAKGEITVKVNDWEDGGSIRIEI